MNVVFIDFCLFSYTFEMNNLETYLKNSYPTPLLSTVLGLFSTHLQAFHWSYEGVTVIVILTRTII